MKKYTGIIKLAALLILLPIALWWATLSKTGKQYQEYRKLSKVQVTAPVHESAIELTKERILTGEAFLGDLGDLASSEGFSIVNYTPSVVKADAGVSILGAKLQAKGRFIPLLKLVRFLEEKDEIDLSSLSLSRKNERENVVTLDVELIQLALDENAR